jgi:hypothetical protein
MSLFRTDWNPSRRHLRHFAWVVSLVLAVAAWRCTGPALELVLRLLAALVFAAGTIWPDQLRGVYRLIVFLTYPVGWVFGEALLAVVYFGLITPLAVCFRVLGRDPLEQRLQPEVTTYWQPRFQVTDYRHYFRQF